MPGNPKREPGAEKKHSGLSRETGRQRSCSIRDPKPSPWLSFAIKASVGSIAGVQHGSRQGHGAAGPTDRAGGRLGWRDTAARGWDATVCI